MVLNKDLLEVLKYQSITSYSNKTKLKYWITSIDNSYNETKNSYTNYNLLQVYPTYKYGNPFLLFRNYHNVNFKTQIVNYYHIYYYKILKDDTQKFRIYSFPSKILAYGSKYLSTSSNIIEIDLYENSILRCDGNKDFIPKIIEDYPIVFESIQRSIYHFFYIENNLLIGEFFPYYETLQYPFIGSIYFGEIFRYFEKKNSGETKDQILWINKSTYQDCINTFFGENVDIPKLTINRPRLAFSKDKQTWYKYDFTNNTFVEITDYNYDNHLANGNTFIEYWKIPVEAWLDFLGGEDNKNNFIYYSVNNYWIPILINPNYLEEYITNKILYILDRGITIDMSLVEV